jgi:hypothetical protein
VRKLTAANRWMIACSLALTGVLAEAAAHAFPGKKLASKSARAASRSPGRSAHSSETPESFHPPEQAPQASGEASPEGDDGSAAPEPAPQSSESPPPSEESSPPTEAPSQAAPEARASEEAPPVVSGGS